LRAAFGIPGAVLQFPECIGRLIDQIERAIRLVGRGRFAGERVDVTVVDLLCSSPTLRHDTRVQAINTGTSIAAYGKSAVNSRRPNSVVPQAAPQFSPAIAVENLLEGNPPAASPYGGPRSGSRAT